MLKIGAELTSLRRWKQRLTQSLIFSLSLKSRFGKIMNLCIASPLLDMDSEAFQAVLALLPMPLRQPTNRRWAHAVPASWMEGYFPICGAWPAFARPGESSAAAIYAAVAAVQSGKRPSCPALL